MASCVCTFQAEGNSGVSGALKLTQNSEAGATVLEGTIRGLTPGQKHGIALCVYGDLSDGGASCGAIFNPFGEFPSFSVGDKCAFYSVYAANTQSHYIYRQNSWITVGRLDHENGWRSRKY